MEVDGKSLATEEALCCARLLLEADWREEEELLETAERLRGLAATRGRWWQFATLATLRWLTLLLSSSSFSFCPLLLKTSFLPTASLLPSFPARDFSVFAAASTFTSLLSLISQHLLFTLILAY